MTLTRHETIAILKAAAYKDSALSKLQIDAILYIKSKGGYVESGSRTPIKTITMKSLNRMGIVSWSHDDAKGASGMTFTEKGKALALTLKAERGRDRRKGKSAALKAATAKKVKTWPKRKPIPWPSLKKVKLTPTQEQVLLSFIDKTRGSDSIGGVFTDKVFMKGHRGYAEAMQLVKKDILTPPSKDADGKLYFSVDLLGDDLISLFSKGKYGEKYTEEDNYLDPESGVIVRTFSDAGRESPRFLVMLGDKVLHADYLPDYSGLDSNYHEGSAKAYLDKNRNKIRLPKAKKSPSAWKLDSEHSDRGMVVKVYTHPNKKEIKVTSKSPAFPKGETTTYKAGSPRIPSNLHGKSLAENFWESLV